MRKEIHSSVMVTASLQEAFPCFFSLNFMSVFEGFKFLPKVKAPIFDINSMKPGTEEIIYFEDGSIALCQLFEIIPEISFSFHIDHFSSRFLGLEAMRCHFSFDDSASDTTGVRCQYQFKFTSKFWNFLYDVFLCRIIQKKLDSFMSDTAFVLKFHLNRG